MQQYIALIHKDAGSDYGVSFPDLPGCVAAGVDLDDARAMAEEALALHLGGMAADEEPIPEPSSLEAVMADRENRDAVAILVKAPPAPAKAVRVNMTIPEDELERIDKFAAEEGYTAPASFFMRRKGRSARQKKANAARLGQWKDARAAADIGLRSSAGSAR
jgi:predicted RNase H-like HicB family nuclease